MLDERRQGEGPRRGGFEEGVRGGLAPLQELAEREQVDALVVPRGVEAGPPLEASHGDLGQALGHGEQGAAPEGSPEREPRDVDPRRGDLVVGVIAAEGLGLGEGLVVVEQPGPEGRERRGGGGPLGVGAADLEGALEAHLGEERVEVELPVAGGGPVPLEPVAQEATEGLADVLQDLAAALEEEHRRIEGPVDVVLVARVLAPDRGHEPRSVVVHVEPDLGPVAEPAPALPLDEGAVGEHRRGDRGQAEGHAELAQGVALVLVVKIDLHRGGAAHHVEAVGSAAGQVDLHEAVASLGDPVEVLLAGVRVEAQAKPGDAQLVGDAAKLVEVAASLGGHAVEVPPGGPGELELPAGLQGHGALAAAEGDQRAARALGLGLPAVALGEGPENGRDADGVAIAHRGPGLAEEADLLGLGADLPEAPRFLGNLKDFMEFGLALEHLILVHREGQYPNVRPASADHQPGTAETGEGGDAELLPPVGRVREEADAVGGAGGLLEEPEPQDEGAPEGGVGVGELADVEDHLGHPGLDGDVVDIEEERVEPVAGVGFVEDTLELDGVPAHHHPERIAALGARREAHGAALPGGTGTVYRAWTAMNPSAGASQSRRQPPS